MRFVSAVAATLCSYGLFRSVVAQSTDHTVKIHAWPLDAAHPQQLAEVSYNPIALTSSVIQFTKPSVAPDLAGNIRIGLYDAATSDWRGIVVPAANFGEQSQQKLSLHVDDEGNVWHVGFSAQPKASVNTKENGVSDQVVVEIVKSSPGPSPILNKPIVLSPEGKVADKEPEKTFIQKYWWVGAIFLVIQVAGAASGGGEK